MPFLSKRPKLKLTDEEIENLTSLSASRTRPLRGIRVSGKNELIERICQYLDEINEMPVIFKWKYKMDEMPGGIESL